MPEGLESKFVIKLDKERSLRLTLKGMIEFKKLRDKDLIKGFNIKEWDTEDYSAFLWACLIHEDKGLTFDKFTDLIDLSNVQMVVDTVIEYVDKTLSTKGGEQDNPLALKSNG